MICNDLKINLNRSAITIW